MTSPEVRRARRTLGAVAIGISVVTWWPAFTLGVWGSVFFEQILTLWATATTAFIIVVLKEGTRRLPRILVVSLLLPTLWIVMSFLPIATGSVLSSIVAWFGAVITVLGLPVMAWVVLQVARPDLTGTVSPRTWLVAGAAVLAVALMSFALGRLHPHFLTCEDFRVSGNSIPANCTPGENSLG